MKKLIVIAMLIMGSLNAGAQFQLDARTKSVLDLYYASKNSVSNFVIKANLTTVSNQLIIARTDLAGVIAWTSGVATVENLGGYVATSHVGNVVIEGSLASGYHSSATGDFAFASGWICSARGVYSTALGYKSTASGGISFAQGGFCTATGTNAVALGASAHATNNYSFVWNGAIPATGSSIGSTNDQQFTINAPGGIRLLGGSIEGDGRYLRNVRATGLNNFTDTDFSLITHVHDYTVITNPPWANTNDISGSNVSADETNRWNLVTNAADAYIVANQISTRTARIAAMEARTNDWNMATGSVSSAQGFWLMGIDGVIRTRTNWYAQVDTFLTTNSLGFIVTKGGL